MDKKFFLVCFVLLLASTANAVKLTGDFSLSTDCWSPASTTYVLYNDSGRTQTYTINAVGENKDWININGVKIGEEPLSITLQDGKSRNLYAFVKPQQCYVTPGDYIVTIEISNDETVRKEINVEVIESRTVELEISPNKQIISQCGEEEFDVKVKNLGERKEEVLLSVEDLPWGWGELSVTRLSLDEGETKKTTLTVTPACNAATKEYIFTVKAELMATTFSTTDSASIEIEDNQEIEIKDEKMDACLEKETVSKIKVKNKGVLEDELVLSVSGVDWVSVNPTELTLEPDEEKVVSLIFSRTSAGEGKHDFTVKAHSNTFEKDTEKELSVELADCYGLSIAKVMLDNEDLDEDPVLCIESEPTYVFTLRNDESETVEAEIRVEGIDTVISPSEISVEPGKQIDIAVKLDLRSETPGEMGFTFSVKGDYASMQKDYNLLLQDCYNLQVDWQGLNQAIELDANCKSELFTVKLENNGTEGQNVSVEVTGVEWVFFEPEEIPIGPGEEKEVYFFFAPPYGVEEGIYNSTVTITSEAGTQRKEVVTNVSSGVEIEIEPEEDTTVNAEIEVDEFIEKLERVIKLKIRLSNLGKTDLKVTNVEAVDGSAVVDFNQATLQPNERVSIPLTLQLGEDSNQQIFSIPLRITTDKGEISRTLLIDLNRPNAETGAPVGFFGLADLSDTLLFGLVIVVIVLIAAVALRQGSTGRQTGTGLTSLAKEVHSLPGKKLEQIGKGRKRSNTLSQLAKEVKKMPAKKTKRGNSNPKTEKGKKK